MQKKNFFRLSEPSKRLIWQLSITEPRISRRLRKCLLIRLARRKNGNQIVKPAFRTEIFLINNIFFHQNRRDKKKPKVSYILVKETVRSSFPPSQSHRWPRVGFLKFYTDINWWYNNSIKRQTPVIFSMTKTTKRDNGIPRTLIRKKSGLVRA